MPPGQSATLNTADAPGSSGIAQRSASREVWNIAEVRGRILRLLEKPELAVMMRVEKKAVYDVARELYATVTYSKAKNNMSVSTLRQRTYCSAVTAVDCRGLLLTPKVLKSITYGHQKIPYFGGGSPDLIKSFLSVYRPEILEIIIPPLVKKLPNLRTLVCGAEAKYQNSSQTSWTVHLKPPRVSSSSVPPAVPAGGELGHIDLIESLNRSFPSEPPSRWSAASSAPAGYTIRHYTNLRLYIPHTAGRRYTPEPELVDRWLTAFREQPNFDQLGTAIRLSRIPVSLGDLTGLCRRQSESGGSQRLEEIEATHTLPFDLPTFTTFAITASSSLRILRLHSGKFLGVADSDMRLTFADLGGLVTVIRQHLPLLDDLCIAIGGIGDAERHCAKMLSEGSLEGGGSVRKCRIVTSLHDPPLLNTVRTIARICAPKAEVLFPHVYHWRTPAMAGEARKRLGEGQEMAHADFLHYLQLQPANVRRHLAIVDFAMLGIKTYAEVSALTFDADGRPHSPLQEPPKAWAMDAQSVSSYMNQTGIPQIAARISEYVTASARLESLPSTVGAAERLQEAERVLAAAHLMEEAGRVVGDLLGGGNRLGLIREHMDTLRAIAGPDYFLNQTSQLRAFASTVDGTRLFSNVASQTHPEQPPPA